jgi:RHS repeat-associated protein
MKIPLTPTVNTLKSLTPKTCPRVGTLIIVLLSWALLLLPTPILGGVLVPVEDYAYDGEGNRTASHLSASYLANEHNQLLEDDSYFYDYDQRGNRIFRASKETGEAETYTYDRQNRLIGYSSSVTEATYAYDALDRRIAKTVDGVETAYVYDMSPDDPLAYDDITLEFEGGILTRRWAHSDAVDEPLGFEAYVNQSGVGSGAEHAIYADRQGSVIWVTDPATGAVVAGYEYDAYGQITQTAGTLVQPYGYTGREYDAESGLYHYRARAYDPASGVFLQVDPVEFEGDQWNIQNYVSNNPVNIGDPTGMFQSVTAQRIGYGSAAVGVAGAGHIFAGVGGLVGTIVKSLTIVGGAPDFYENKKNPSNCPDFITRPVQKIIDELKQLPGCKNGLAPMDNLRTMIKITTEITVRSILYSACYQGGDTGHKQPIKDKLTHLRNKCVPAVFTGPIAAKSKKP